MQPLPRPLRGIVPPILTPLTDECELDVAGLQRLVDRMIDGGVHGIFALGTTGEGPFLTHKIRHQVIDVVCERVEGRIPVLVSITDTCFRESIELAEMAYASGAAGLVATAPYYLMMSQHELAQHFARLADRCPLPLLIYNIPSCTRTDFAAETVRTLADHENVVGLKDSCGDLQYFAEVVQLCRDLPDFSLLVGPEERLVEALKLGGHGGVHGGANLFPQLYVRLFEAATSGDEKSVEQLNGFVQQISQTIYSVDDAPSRIVRGLKAAARLMGICNDYVAEPFRAFDQDQRDQICRHLETLLPTLAPKDLLQLEVVRE